MFKNLFKGLFSTSKKEKTEDADSPPPPLTMFMQLAGIKGECKDPQHKDEIIVLNWTFGASHSGVFHDGSGGHYGKSKLRDFHFEKYMDSASPELFKYSLTGKHIPEVKFSIRNNGKEPLDFLQLTLNKVIISSLDYDIVEDGRKIREILTLTFAEIQYEFFKPAKKQGVTENYSLRYDVAQKILI